MRSCYEDVTKWESHHRTAKGMARTFQITSLFPKLTVIDNPFGDRRPSADAKFVMWRFQFVSYKEVYEKAHRLLEQAASSTAWTSRCATPTASSANLEIVLGLASDPKILLLMSRRRPVIGGVDRDGALPAKLDRNSPSS